MTRIPRKILLPGLIITGLLIIACAGFVTSQPPATPTPLPSSSPTSTPEIVSRITILEPEKVSGKDYRGPINSGEWFTIKWEAVDKDEVVECDLSIAPNDTFEGVDEYKTQAPEVSEPTIAVAYLACVFTDGGFELQSVPVLFNPKPALPQPPGSNTSA